MNNAINWAVTNWAAVAAVALAMLTVLNKFTRRWDEGQKHTLTRVLLVITELLSVLTSKGWRTNAGPLKLPLTLRSGRRGSIFPPSAPIVFMIGGLVTMPALPGCASSTEWRKDADRAIRAAHETSKAGWATARAVLHQRCIDAGKACVAEEYEGEMEDCDQVQRCRAARFNHATAYRGVQSMLSLAAEALHQYDIAADSYRDNHELSASDEEIERELAVKKAEVHERIDRAKRATVNLIRTLGDEGLNNEGG